MWLAGLASNLDKASAIQDAFTSYGFQNSSIALSSDVDLAKQLIKEEGEGAILISGTGSICLAKYPRGERRIGGHGYALGDEGSGFYIGKLALQAACEEELKPFALTNSICGLFSVVPASKVKTLFYSGVLKPSDIVKICPLVFKNDFIGLINTKVGYQHGLQFINISQANIELLAIRANK